MLLVLVPGPRSPGQAAPPRMESETDIAGRFEFDVVPAGCYAVKASSAGLAGEGSEICLLAPGGVVDLAIELKSGVLKESVEVSAEPEGIETVVDSATLSDVPSINERFQDYLPLLPGVIRGPDGRINLKGARAAQGGALVDGANVTDPVTGETAINLPIDAVSSVSVLSNPYDSQYGKFAGAVSTVDTGGFALQQVSFQNPEFPAAAPKPGWRDRRHRGIHSASYRFHSFASRSSLFVAVSRIPLCPHRDRRRRAASPGERHGARELRFLHPVQFSDQRSACGDGQRFLLSAETKLLRTQYLPATSGHAEPAAAGLHGFVARRLCLSLRRRAPVSVEH